MAIDKDEVRRIARLANLEYPRVQSRDTGGGSEGVWAEPAEHLLDEAALNKLAGDLSGILDHVRQLDEVDVTGIEPTRHGVVVAPAFRDDTPSAPTPTEALLEGVPERVGDAISVPRIVE